jgi:hypothetical protein
VSSTDLIGLVLGYLPYVLPLLAGALLAILTWRRHPKASAFALGGMAALLLGVLIEIVLFFLVIHQPSRAMIYTWLHIPTALLELAGWALLLVALFGRRPGDLPNAAQARPWLAPTTPGTAPPGHPFGSPTPSWGPPSPPGPGPAWPAPGTGQPPTF